MDDDEVLMPAVDPGPPHEEPVTYSVLVSCRNCGFGPRRIEVQRGSLLTDALCPKCGTHSLYRA